MNLISGLIIYKLQAYNERNAANEVSDVKYFTDYISICIYAQHLRINLALKSCSFHLRSHFLEIHM